jgi:hypothetical protein
MKGKLFILFILPLNLTLLAQYNQLTVFHKEGERFWVVMNGQKQNDTPSEKVHIPEIRENYIKLKIIFENEQIHEINKNVQLKNIVLGKTHTVLIIKPKNKNRSVIRFYSNQKAKSTKKTQI